MMSTKSMILVLCLACLLLCQVSCYGPFNLTRSVHKWNGEVDEKWGNEGIFLLCAFFPVYGLCILGDALIFNSIEFWGGENPIHDPYMNE